MVKNPLARRISFSGKESLCRRGGFNPWVGKILWRRKWQPPPVFLPGRAHGQKSLAGYSPLVHKVRHDLVTKQQIIYTLTHSGTYYRHKHIFRVPLSSHWHTVYYISVPTLKYTDIYIITQWHTPTYLEPPAPQYTLVYVWYTEHHATVIHTNICWQRPWVGIQAYLATYI